MSLRYCLLLIAFSFTVKGQVILLNNPSIHIVAVNPAFSAIKSSHNRNYRANQFCVSTRASKDQVDAIATAQYFFSGNNIGLSADYTQVEQSKSRLQKMGLGLSYQLIFFDAISTGWGIGLSYAELNTATQLPLTIYRQQKEGFIQDSKYTSLKFGWLINYERFMAGISIQPKQTVFFNNMPQGTCYLTSTAYFKYQHPLTRSLSALFWYNGNWDDVDHLKSITNELKNQKLQSHAFNIHLAGRKGLIGGIGTRVTNFNYTSVIAKAGYNFKYFQVLYGVEPYWLNGRYSEIIHELSFTLKM